MVRRFPRLLFLLLVIACFCTVASAAQIGVGDLSYDQISSTVNQFDITNLTGPAGVDLGDPTDFPITTTLTFSVTSLVVNFTSGPAITLPGSDFTPTTNVFTGDEDLDCTGTGCNLFGDSVASATLTGTLSPTTGLGGLPPGDTGILPGFSTTITSSCNPTAPVLVAGCDTMEIFATPTTGVTAPEPGTWALVGIGIIGLLVGRRRLRGGIERFSTTNA